MKKADQKRITSEICDRVRDKICAQIEAGEMPENFDGFEIRWLLSDVFNREARVGDRSRRFRYLRQMCSVYGLG